MEVSSMIGEWLLGAFQYIFQERILPLYKELMGFISAFIVSEGSLQRFPFIFQLTLYVAAVVNSLLILIILWYGVKKMFTYAGFEVDNPLMFFSKLIFYGVLANFGFYITEYIVWIFSGLTRIITNLQVNLDYFSVKEALVGLVPQEASELFSVEGIFLIITMFCVIKLCFTFSTRFILITFVITPLAPLAIISNMSQAMSGIFKGWLKLLLTLMTSQMIQLLLLVCVTTIILRSGLNIPRMQVSFYILCVFWLMSRIDIYVKDIVAGIGVYNNLSSGLSGIQNSINLIHQSRSIIIKK